MRIMKSVTTAVALCASLLAATSATAQVQLRYSVGFPSGAPVDGAKLYAEAVKKFTNNSVNVRVFDTALLSLPEMSGGVAKGVSDIGYVLGPYWPAEYPHLNMASELSMLLALQPDPAVKGGLAYAGAFAEFVMLRCPECVADFAKQNQLFTGAVVSPPFTLQCTKPMSALADIKGARLRVGGAAWARWAKQIGAAPVTMPGNEMFEALKQKVVDCTVLASAELSAWNLREVVSDANIDIPAGVFSGSAVNINLDAWRKLNEAQRTGMLRAGALMTAHATFLYRANSRRDIEQFVAKGGRLNKTDPALLKASHEAIEADIPNIAANYTKQYNVKRANELVAGMRPLVDKWVKLVAGVETADAFTDLYWREIYSKVDVKTYGMK
ncbi:MAG: C4-dicarboxylate TRAP transporter substrate-binding protein [Pseudomonadota bacterium]